MYFEMVDFDIQDPGSRTRASEVVLQVDILY